MSKKRWSSTGDWLLSNLTIGLLSLSLSLSIWVLCCLSKCHCFVSICRFECYFVHPNIIGLSPSVHLSAVHPFFFFFFFFFFLICVFKCYVDHPNFVSVCPFDCYAVYSDIIVMPLSSHLSALLSIQIPLFCLFSVLLSVILPVSQCVEGCVVMVLVHCLCHREDRTYQHKEKRRTSLTCLICMVKVIGISL